MKKPLIFLAYKIKVSLLLNYFIDKRSKFKRFRKFFLDRDRYKNESDRYKLYSRQHNFINLGAGSHFYHPRWQCFDIYSNGINKIIRNFIYWDFTSNQKLPSTYKLAYCSHVVEHIPDSSLLKFLDNIYQALDPSGIARFVCPDADLAYQAYAENRYDFFEAFDSKLTTSIDQEFKLEFQLLNLFATEKTLIFTAADALAIKSEFKRLSKRQFLDYLTEDIKSNNSPSGHFHVNWFDFHKLSNLLNKVGFQRVERSAFGQSKSPAMRDIPLFDSTLPSMSMYIEAIK